METNLFTVFNAVKSERASQWGLSAGPKEQGIPESSWRRQELTRPRQFQPVESMLSQLSALNLKTN